MSEREIRYFQDLQTGGVGRQITDESGNVVIFDCGSMRVLANSTSPYNVEQTQKQLGFTEEITEGKYRQLDC